MLNEIENVSDSTAAIVNAAATAKAATVSYGCPQHLGQVCGCANDGAASMRFLDGLAKLQRR